MSKRTTTCPFRVEYLSSSSGIWMPACYEKNERLARKALNNWRKFHTEEARIVPNERHEPQVEHARRPERP
jgi:hypothetical protein